MQQALVKSNLPIVSSLQMITSKNNRCSASVSVSYRGNQNKFNKSRDNTGNQIEAQSLITNSSAFLHKPKAPSLDQRTDVRPRSSLSREKFLSLDDDLDNLLTTQMTVQLGIDKKHFNMPCTMTNSTVQLSEIQGGQKCDETSISIFISFDSSLDSSL